MGPLKTYAPWLAAALVAVTLLMAGLGLNTLMVERNMEQVQATVERQVMTLRTQIEGELNAAVFLVDGLANYVSAHPELDNDDFNRFARQMMRADAPIRHITLAPDNVIEHAYPLEGNEAAIGVDIGEVPDQSFSVDRMVDEQRTVVAGPLELVQGGEALIIRTPVLTDDGSEYWGMASVPIELDTMYQRLGLDDIGELTIALRGRDGVGAAGDTFFGDEHLFDDPRSVTHDIHFSHNQWQIAAAPREGWSAATALPPLGWLALPVLMLLMGGTAWQLTRQAVRLRDSESQYRELVQGVNGVVLRWGADGQVRFINEFGSRLFGYSPDELLGQHVIGTIVPVQESTGRDLVAMIDAIQRETEKYIVNENEVMTRDGKRLWMLWSNQPLRDDHGQVREILSVGHDHTRRREAELELQQAQAAILASETRYRTLTESLREVVFQTDSQRRITYINPAWSRITGWAQDDATGCDLIELLRPEDQAEARSACDAFIQDEHAHFHEEYRVPCQDGSLRWMQVSAERIPGEGPDDTTIIGTMVDITDYKAQEERIQHLAMHDNLTGLANRRLFEERLHQAMSLARRNDRSVALLFIDLDGFKPVNDELGHHAGDKLLQCIARRLEGLVRTSDTVARFGGDEFMVLLQEVDGIEAAEHIAAKVIEALHRPVDLGDYQCHPGGSVGISLFPDHGETSDRLVGAADKAMYAAKRAGRGVYRSAPE